MAIFAAVVEERVAGEDVGGMDFGDEDGVVAGGVGVDEMAGQLGEGVFKNGDAGGNPSKVNA